jgi:hypothetical protein
MARFRVCLKTVVNVSVDVEAPDAGAAVKAAEEKPDFEKLVHQALPDGTEVSWGEEHVYALVDEVGAGGEMVSDDPGEYQAAGYTRTRDQRPDWTEVRAPFYAPEAR